MGRKRTYAPLDVFMNRRKVGQFFREPDGAFAFTYASEWLCCTNTVGDSSRESSVVAGLHEQTHPPRLRDEELAGL